MFVCVINTAVLFLDSVAGDVYVVRLQIELHST